MTCGPCVAADRNWDPQYLRDPGKLCEAHERALDRLGGLVPLVRTDHVAEPIMSDVWKLDANPSS